MPGKTSGNNNNQKHLSSLDLLGKEIQKRSSICSANILLTSTPKTQDFGLAYIMLAAQAMTKQFFIYLKQELIQMNRIQTGLPRLFQQQKVNISAQQLHQLIAQTSIDQILSKILHSQLHNSQVQYLLNEGNEKIINLLINAGASLENCSLKNISTLEVIDEPPECTTPKRPSCKQSQFQSTTRSAKQMTYLGSNIETSDFESRLGRASTVKLSREITTDSFTFHKKIGKGAFGVVYLVTDHKTNEKMALKVLEKSQLTEKMIQYMLSEKQVMMQINHPFIVKLRYAFQNEKYLFLAMNYFQGGDLGAVLGLQTLPEPVVKIYAAEIALALGELHKRNFIYRDLKPQNILIHSDGHCAITDFGLTKSIDENTKSFCGTPAYMAPEIVSHKSYNQSVDWYQLGAVVYEMLYGEPPYFSQDREELYENIKSETLTFFSSINVSEIGKSFIKQLLHRNPEKRLGAQKDLSEVMLHPWFKDIDWQKLANKEIPVPKPYFNTNSENIIYPDFENDEKSSKKLVENWTVLGQ